MEAAETATQRSGAAGQWHIVSHKIVHGREGHPLPEPHHAPGQHHCWKGQPSCRDLQPMAIATSLHVTVRYPNVKSQQESACE